MGMGIYTRRGQESDTHKQAASQQPDQGQTLAHFRDRFKSTHLSLDSTWSASYKTHRITTQLRPVLDGCQTFVHIGRPPRV